MDDDPTAQKPPTRRRPAGRHLRTALVAGGAALGLTLAGLGVAAAQTDSTTPAPAPNAPAPGQPPAPGPDGSGRRGKAGHGMGMGIHGEHVTPAPGGGYQTVATQKGEVIDVNDSSIAVKSEDGFTRTYSVDDNTLVNAGNQGIADVKKGDQVHVRAIVKGANAAAVQVNDATQTGRIRDRWMPPRPAPGTAKPPN